MVGDSFVDDLKSIVCLPCASPDISWKNDICNTMMGVHKQALMIMQVTMRAVEGSVPPISPLTFVGSVA